MRTSCFQISSFLKAKKIISEIENSQIIFTLLMDKIQIEYLIGYLYTVCTNMSRVTVRIV